jgi:hypothetical protein
VRVFPTTTMSICASGSPTYCPIRFNALPTCALEPVRKLQPFLAPMRPAWAFRAPDVSRAGSTLIEISRTSCSSRSPRRLCTAFNVFIMTGQLPVQLAKKLWITTVRSSIRSR